MTGMDIPSHLQKAKLCSLRKWESFAGYGFNLHSDKGKLGQFIGKVDPNSPAEHGGLKPNDVLIEVNGINVEEASHNIVVGRVKSMPDKVDLFVCSQDTYKYCQENGIKLSSAMHNINEHNTPLRQPSPPPVVEEAAGAAAASSLRAPVDAAGGADFEEVKAENLPERFQSQQDQRPTSQASASGESAQRDSNPPPSFAVPVAATAASPAVARAAAAKPAGGGGGGGGTADPVGGLSLEEVRARLGQNKRTQVKLNSGTFSEKYSVFESL